MGKTTSLIESQHHHLLHCLEKTTVSPSPAPPPFSSLTPDPFQQSELTECELYPHPHPGPKLQKSKSVPLEQKSSDEVSINPQKEDPKGRRPALPCSGTEEAIPLGFPHNPSISIPMAHFLVTEA